MENKKYHHISEFIENTDLVIKCEDLEQAKMVGSYLWKKVNMTNWYPSLTNFPIICWFSNVSSGFNPLTHVKKTDIVVPFNNVVFNEEVTKEDMNYLIPFLEKL